MKKMRWMLALAAVAAMAIGCGEEDTKTTTTTDTTSGGDTAADTAGDATATTDTSTGDTTAADTASDATATSGAKGCTADGDKAYVTKLGSDAALAAKFSDDLKNCTLASASKEEAAAKEAISKCVVGKGHDITETCGGCYGIRAFCTFKNCVANATESPTANCIADPGGTTCTACANKYNCIQASEDCKAGK